MIKRIFFLVVCVFLIQGEAWAINARVNDVYATFEAPLKNSDIYATKKNTFRLNFDAFETGPVADLMSLTDTQKTLEMIIGDQNMALLSSDERDMIAQDIQESFRRYAYEWLFDDSMGAMRLVGVEAGDGAQETILKIERIINFLPDFVFDVYAHNVNGAWKAYDFGILGIRYSGLKRSAYLKNLKLEGAQGLSDFLQAKNIKFFRQLCRSKNVERTQVEKNLHKDQKLPLNHLSYSKICVKYAEQ